MGGMHLGALSFLFSLILSGCVPTLGSEFVGKGHLAKGEYIDLNTVPESAEAQKPSGLHKGDEHAARREDQGVLEKKRLDIEAAGQKLREKAFSPSPASFSKKDSKNGQKPGP